MVGFTRLIPASIRRRLGLTVNSRMDQFEFDQLDEIQPRIKNLYGYSGKLLEIFAGNQGEIVHKWHHYIPIYDRYLSRYRGTNAKILEIGVQNGGSLSMWRNFFGHQATLFGIDIDPSCAALNGKCGQVRIGSQSDTDFLESIVAEMGGVDVVIDDGSHIMGDIRKSLTTLFPLLNDGGLYLIEDLHTCYWKTWGGGYKSRASFFHMVSELIDDMHHWYHDSGVKHNNLGNAISGMHIYDSMVIFDKGPVHTPAHSKVG